MKRLEEEVDELEELDDLRVASARMRDWGRHALRKVEKGWHPSTSSMERALIVKALCDRQEGPPREQVQKLEGMTAEEIIEQPVSIPILRAARSMQALAAAPDSAFSESLLAFYYQIVRELYTADSPDWRLGGARANAGGSASAYVTGECVRAILSFVRTLDNTGFFVKEVLRFRKRKRQLENDAVPRRWREVELERLGREFYAVCARQLDNIAFKLAVAQDADGLLTPEVNSFQDFLDQVQGQIATATRKTAEAFERVRHVIRDFRTGEKQRAVEADQASEKGPGILFRSQARKAYDRSETGHAIAFGAIDQGLAVARAAADLFSDLDSEEKQDKSLEELSIKFKAVAAAVKRLIHPARIFLSTVLDRELTAASSEARPGWDPGEMVFAAVSYGFAAGSWDDDRLRQAGLCLSEELSERGRFRSGKPFHSDPEANHYDVNGAEVLRAFAQLLENVTEIPVSDRLVKRMLHFFDDTLWQFPESDCYGWYPDLAQGETKPIRATTAVSVLALDRVNRMLDVRINDRVLRHFSVKKNDALKVPSLAELFYPDYGLRHKDCRPRGDGSWEQERPLAIALEKLRTHVSGLSRREPEAERLFSLILYGPPGTGKTTLVESLAKSAGAPLVEITPSDIVSSGVDAVERRARAVFRALSFLTRAVIIFDEFDPVLKRRNPNDQGPSTVFSFLTPGMLPKLKRLHETAKGRSVAYVLITNLIGTLDDAAIRSGRFDLKLGVYPPDPLSREGRLVNEVLAFKARSNGAKLSDQERARILQVVRLTAGGPMEELARKGWFVSPGEKVPEGSPFEYICLLEKFQEGGRREIFPPPPEADLERASKEGRVDKLEYRQWKWIERWDDGLRLWLKADEGEENRAPDLAAVEKSVPPDIHEFPKNGDGQVGFFTLFKDAPAEGTRFVVLRPETG